MTSQETEKTNFIRGRRVVYSLSAHLVFIAKYRKCVFTSDMLKTMQQVMMDVCHDMGAELMEFNGEENHVHLLVSYPPTLSISKLVNSLKGVSSRYLRKEHSKELSGKLWGGHLWSPSYFASSVGGASLEVVRNYIENQDRPSH